MMNALHKSLVLIAPTLALLLSVATAHAEPHVGKITRLYARDDGVVFFEVSGDRGKLAECATGGMWIIKDEKSDYGQKQFAMLAQAAVARRAVVIYGAGTCSRYPGSEDVSAVGVVQ